jgi:hypothetical protein
MPSGNTPKELAVPRYSRETQDLPENEDLGQSLRRQHQELYGKLLEAHAEVDSAGTLTVWVYLALLLAAYGALWTGWYQQLPALAGMNLNNFWTYLVLLVVALFAYGATTELSERLRYGRHSQEVQNLASRAGVSRLKLLAQLEGDAAVKKALAMIKRERWQ